MTRIYYTDKDGNSKEMLILANDDSIGQLEADKLTENGNSVYLVEFNAHAKDSDRVGHDVRR